MMRAYSRPLMVSGLGRDDEVCSALEPISLKAGEGDVAYSERWLQMLIQRHPALLPVQQIEPGLNPLVPVCVELPLPCGYADNLFITPDGGIVLVEAKLWRNPEARREVVGQVLDYAKDLSGWSYEDLQAGVRIARREPHADLFRLVCGDDAASEAEATFIDAVSRNLRLGRLLLIVAGDGVQESVEKLTAFLQRHVGLHFTLSLVEISLWREPASGQVFVQPKVVTRTVQIERAVVRLEAGLALQVPDISPASPTARPQTLSSEQFYDLLGRVDATLPNKLRAFFEVAEPYGVYPDIQRRMTLKWRSRNGREFMLGGVDKEGRFMCDVCHAATDAIGRVDLSHAYQARLGELITGAVIRKTPTPAGWRLLLDGRDPPVRLLLEYPEAWLDAIQNYITQLEAAVASD